MKKLILILAIGDGVVRDNCPSPVKIMDGVKMPMPTYIP